MEVPLHYIMGIKIHQQPEKTKGKGLFPEELIKKQKFWTKKGQQRYKNEDKFKSDTENSKKTQNISANAIKNTKSLSCFFIHRNLY